MADPVKKDDALASAMREAFQRHMENAALAARSGLRPSIHPETASRSQIFSGRGGEPNPVVEPPPAPPRQSPALPEPVNDEREAEHPLPARARVDQIDLVPERGVTADRRWSDTPTDFVPDPGADLAQRARDAVFDIEPHRSTPRLRPPPAINDVLGSELQGMVALLDRPVTAPAEAQPKPADRVVAAPAVESRPAPAPKRPGMFRRLMTWLSILVLLAALAGWGAWLLQGSPNLRQIDISQWHIGQLNVSRVISVVRGMWATHSVTVPLEPVSQAPAPAGATGNRITVASTPAPDTTSELLAGQKADMRPRRVKTESVKLDPIALAVQDAEDRLAAGNLAAARLILEQYRGSGDARALFALAQTYDPTEQHNPEAQDRKQAEALYEEAARAGSQQSAERLARLRIGTAN